MDVVSSFSSQNRKKESLKEKRKKVSGGFSLRRRTSFRPIMHNPFFFLNKTFFSPLDFPKNHLPYLDSDWSEENRHLTFKLIINSTFRWLSSTCALASAANIALATRQPKRVHKCFLCLGFPPLAINPPPILVPTAPTSWLRSDHAHTRAAVRDV